MYRRNLSFNSNIWELALQGDFNFFRFMPGEPGFNFTPYITLGVGAFSYDPFAYLRITKKFTCDHWEQKGRAALYILIVNNTAPWLSVSLLGQGSNIH